MKETLQARKPKILYLVTQSKWGGTQRYVYDLSVNLKNDFDIVVAAGGYGELLARLGRQKVKTRRASYLARSISPLKDVLAFRKIREIIKVENPDIVHTNSSKAEILGNLAAALLGKKFVFTAHGFVFNEPMNSLKRRFFVWLERFANRKTEKIICVSDFDRKAAISWRIASEEKFITIRNGLKLEDYNQNVGSYADKRGKVIVGTLANLEPNKGILYLAQAAAMLPLGLRDKIEFQVAGEGPQRADIEAYLRKKKVENFSLLGFLDNPDNFLRYLDIFVLPSVKEGFPYALLEAMAAGKAIIASRVGGVSEMIEDGRNGILVKPANPSQILEKIIFLFENPNSRAELGVQARKRCFREFTLDKMLAMTRSVYEKILGR